MRRRSQRFARPGPRLPRVVRQDPLHLRLEGRALQRAGQRFRSAVAGGRRVVAAARGQNPSVDCRRGAMYWSFMRRRLDLEMSRHSMLQILSVPPFEKAPLPQLLPIWGGRKHHNPRSTDFAVKPAGRYCPALSPRTVQLSAWLTED